VLQGSDGCVYAGDQRGNGALHHDFDVLLNF
jgi:hypothetical protein